MSNLVRFEGPWQERERLLVKEAIQKAETSILATARPAGGVPWVAVHHAIREDEDLYAASRFRISTVMTATSPETLAREIHEL